MARQLVRMVYIVVLTLQTIYGCPDSWYVLVDCSTGSLDHVFCSLDYLLICGGSYNLLGYAYYLSGVWTVRVCCTWAFLHLLSI